MSKDSQPTDAATLLRYATSLGNQFRLPEAVDAYRQALAIAPSHAPARHNLGALLAQMDRAEEALEQLTRAEQLGFRRAILYVNRGRALTQLYRLDEAERSFLRAVEFEPRNVDAQLMLAQLRFMRGDANCARDVTAAASANRSDLNLQLLMADILRRMGNLIGAEKVLRDALEHASAPRLRATLASTLHEQGRLDEALVEAEAAAAGAPNDTSITDTSVRETLVSILLSLGRPDAARPFIREQRARDPHNQLWIAHESTAARLAIDPVYHEICDYQRFVQVFDLGPPSGALLEALNARHPFANHPLDQSLRHGSQTARSLLTDSDPSIGALLAAFAEPLRQYQESLGDDPGHPFLSRNLLSGNAGPAALTGCWSVQLRRAGFHLNHVHPRGWISSACYVSVPPEADDAIARSGWLKFGEPRLPAAGATPERFVQPRAGRLVLFPSYFWHGTNPIHGAEARTTVAFDAHPATRRA